MLGKLRIRGKLALVVALPLLAVALLTLPGVTAAVDRADRADQIGQSMQVTSRVTSLASELALERLVSLGYLFEVVDESRVVAQSARVTDQITDIRHEVEEGRLRGALPEPVSAALDAVRELEPLREAVLARGVPPLHVVGGYDAVITGLYGSLRLLDGLDLANPAARQVAALDALLRVNQAGREAIDLLLVITATDSDEAVFQYLANQLSLGANFPRFIEYADPAQLAVMDLVGEAFTAREETGVGVAFTPDPREATAGYTAATIFPALESLSRFGRFAEKKIITDVLIEVEAQGEAALRTAYLVSVGSLLVLLTVVTLTTMMARTVVRPLISLTSSAHRVARVADEELARIADDEADLPESVRLEQIKVTAQDEIGDLARAFDRVQAVAVRLVERQVTSRRNVALMFAYLGRRTQNLVGRQIDIIDQLEQDEVDGERLAELYRLDHISSRLRRNAGSLVVLSGSTSADEHMAPLPLADVVRLALGEIEDFQRVDVDVPAGITLVPSVVGDLVLVLAELMENATTFSPPHTRVVVSAVASGSGAHISIIDNGIGMSPQRLAEENARLAKRERLDLAPTEVLGLFVVGRLARRHGVRVTLTHTRAGGVTAVIELDHRLLVKPAPPAPRAITVAVSSADGRAAGTHESDAGPAGSRRPHRLFDAEALDQASRILETSRSWNAFALPPGVPAGQDQAGVPAAPERTAAPAAKTAPAPPPPPAAPPSPANGAPPGLSGLRRRLPGATLSPSSTPSPPQPVAGPAPDPEEARQLVEQLQSGVTRALKEIRSPNATEKEHKDDR